MSHSYSSDISREQFARLFGSARRRTKPRRGPYDVFRSIS